jgi:hypothetical protein
MYLSILIDDPIFDHDSLSYFSKLELPSYRYFCKQKTINIEKKFNYSPSLILYYLES